MTVDHRALVEVIMLGYAHPAYGGFVPPGMPGHVPDSFLRFDPEKARALLTEAEFPHGQNFPELPVFFFPARQRHVRFLCENWRELLGINLVPEIVHSLDELPEREPYIALGGWLADYPDPDNFLRVDVELTVPHWRHETYQNLLRRASKLMDQSERLALYRQAEHILAEEACLVPLAYSEFHLMIKPWVKRYPSAAVKNFGFWKDVVIEPIGE